jgi:acyl-CoA synthetase (AMP-forming)/AMP-acid ligase II
VPELAGKAAEAAAGSPVRDVVVIGGPQDATPLARILEKGRGLIEAGGWQRAAADPQSDIAVILYSSGTTGGPKGVLLTHRNLVANVLQCQASLPPGTGDTVIAALPFSHVYGIVILMTFNVWRGTTVVCFPRFDLASFLGAVQDWRSHTLFAVPPIVLALAKHPLVEQFDLAVDRIICGAAPLGDDVQQDCSQRLGCVVGQAWGMTECGLGSANPLDRPDQVRPGSAEVPKAFVVIRGGIDLTELESWVAQQVAPYKRIRRFEVVAEIPRTPSGKILRRVLIEQERAAAGLS